MEYVREMDPERKRLLLSKLFDRITRVSDKLEKILRNNMNKTGSGFYVGNSLTLADIFSLTFYYSVETLVMPGFMAQYYQSLLLRDHVARVRDLPGIKEYLASASHTHLPSWDTDFHSTGR